MRARIFLCGGAERFANYAAAIHLAGGVLARSADVCDGLLLPGGGDLDPVHYHRPMENCRGLEPERDVLELSLCARFFAEKKPILGICRGAQVLAVALGGTLLQDVPGHGGLPNGDDGVHETDAAGVLKALYGARFAVNSWHHQAVERLPSGCRVLQRADDGVVEAFDHETLPLLAVQWHPERLCGGFARPDAVSGLPLLGHFMLLCEGVS